MSREDPTGGRILDRSEREPSEARRHASHEADRREASERASGSERSERHASHDADLSFEGRARADGSVGARNHVLVLPSVICSHMVADRIADRVPGAVSAPHDHGCAQIGADNEQTERTFRGVARNPNVAGTVVVGLGCEHVQSDAVADRLDDAGERVRELSIQGVGGTDPTVARGARAAGELVEAAADERVTAGADALTVGIVATDLAAGTVAEAAPLVGAFADAVVAAGGRVVAAGSEPLIAHPEAAREAAADDATAADVETLFDRHESHPPKARAVHRAAADRSFAAATRAWGDQPIREVCDYGAPASLDRGLAVVDAPSEFAEAATGLVAAGAQVIVHVTDEGVPTGHPVAPVVKVTGNEATYAALPDDVDVDATTAAVADLRERVAAVLDGDPSCAERHGVDDFAITRVGPSL
ncbi:UxaA family hydrolase [Halomicrobium salinisoli]|uniref:UxaA family hydrolase n=1 Tax=Halomicrobium salinisoli TaxID=2878391 RepID=UPI001CF079B8|nr:UxaA family hydrolase [Halomicrobium salinisoli]